MLQADNISVEDLCSMKVWVAKDILGTRYLIDSINRTIDTLFQAALTASKPVDLRDCRCGPKAALLIKDYEDKGVMFVNSTEFELNEMLKNNRTAIKFQYPELLELDVPDITSPDEVFDVIRKLPSGSFKLNSAFMQKPYSTTLVCLILMARPDIDLDIRGYASFIFDCMKMYNWQEYYNLGITKFYALQSNEVIVIDIDESPEFKGRELLPAEIGSTVILDLSSDEIKISRTIYQNLILNIVTKLENILYTPQEEYVSLIEHLQEVL